MSKQKIKDSKAEDDDFISKTGEYKTIQSWKQAANKAGDIPALNPVNFPNDAKGRLDRLNRVNLMGNQKRIVIRTMSRQKVRTVDNRGKPVDRDMLVYVGELFNKDSKGLEYGAEFTIGKYQKARVVPLENQQYDPRTGEAKLSEKVIWGSIPVYELEVPEKERKKIIDDIIGDNHNHPDNILFYYNELVGPGNNEFKSDNAFSYDDFVNCSIEELKKMSARGGGSRSTGIYRDKDGKLRDKDGNLI